MLWARFRGFLNRWLYRLGLKGDPFREFLVCLGRNITCDCGSACRVVVRGEKVTVECLRGCGSSEVIDLLDGSVSISTGDGE